ncbi:AB hydrolase superfamily protein [Sphaerulina musiva]
MDNYHPHPHPPHSNTYANTTPPAEPTNNLLIYQPLHPTMRTLLDPEYVAFHDSCIQYLVPDEQLHSWNSRSSPLETTLSEGGGAGNGNGPCRVGLVRDVQLERCRVRIFVPAGSNCSSTGGGGGGGEQGVVVPGKYPVLYWLHGGGWVTGGLDSENDFLMYLCQTSQCIVVTIDYRLAPEFPYPNAAEDAVEALVWLLKEAPKYYAMDLERVAIGGTCAGGNLAAVLVLEAACLFPSFKPVLMLLIVPVIDNTALPGEGWYNLHSPWLTPARMLWYRRMYLPHGNGRDERYPERENWQTSPNLAPSKILSRCPPTWLAVAEYDLLATEALAFSSQLRASGVQTTVKVYPGSTHAILALSGVLSKGRELMLDAAQALNGAFWPIRMDPLLGWTLCSS